MFCHLKKDECGLLSHDLTSFSLLNPSKFNWKGKKSRKILKLLLKVIFLLHASCEITVSSKKPFHTHIDVPLKPFKPSLVSPSPNGDLEFQVEMQNLFIALVHFSATMHKYMEQKHCLAICLLSSIAFPFDWGGESASLLSSPCSQRFSPAFGPGQLLRVSCFGVAF